MFGEDLFSASTSVDTHHCHTNRPRSITDGHLQIGIICLEKLFLKTFKDLNNKKASTGQRGVKTNLHIFSLQHELNDVCDRLFDIGW